MNFEQAIAQLEKTVKALESEEMELQKAMDSFEEGIKLIAQCRELLDKAEQKVEYLLKKED